MAPKAWDNLKHVLPPDVLDTLSNNQPLSPGILQTARALREQPLSFTSAIESRLRTVKKTMTALRKEKENLSDKDHIRTAMDEACTALCSPIRRIPNDLLLEIARHSLADQPSLAQNATPINLSQLSSTWRNVVVNSPGLWTTLYLRVPGVSNVAYLIKQIQIIEMWFRRASSLPLSLFLYVECRIDGKTEAYNFSQFLKALAQWAPRLHRFGIGGQYWPNLMASFVDIKWDLKSLQELDFLGPLDVRYEADIAILASLQERLILFRSAKRLTSVVSYQEMTPFLQSFGFLPWDQIQHVSMTEDTASGSELSRLFMQCPNLRMAFISWCRPEFSRIGDQSTNLEKLELHGIIIDDYRELVVFFTRIACPRLTHLAITIDKIEDAEEDLPAYTPIAVPAFESLSFLWLCGDTQLPTEFVLDLLGKMPRLRILYMQLPLRYDCPCAIDLNQLCQAMTISDTQHDVVPLLEECTFWRGEFNRSDPVLLDVATISQFISSRAQSHLLSPNYNNLKKVSFLGSFAFMIDLCGEVLRISTEKPSVEITVVQDLVLKDEPNISNLHHQLDFRRSPFYLETYFVGHPLCPDAEEK